MITIHSRLAELLAERGMTAQVLATKASLPVKRVEACCDRNNDALSLHELGMIMSALGNVALGDLFDTVVREDAAAGDRRGPVLKEADWHSVCAAAPDGVHRWYKDMSVSDSIYQEFVCHCCGWRLAVIL